MGTAVTTVARFCANFVEAAWLVAAVLVAAFLNPFSDQVFEPDKVVLLRALVLLMLAGGIIRILDRAALGSLQLSSVKNAVGMTARALQRMPIAVLALVICLAYLISTVISVSPHVSWWGSYQRAQGTYTFLVYLALFFIVLTTLRRADQLQRLITTLLVTSFPVALYAILQHYGMSLVRFSESGVEARVISTLGNAIFLGAYLAMVVPLTLWRLLDSLRSRPAMPARGALASLMYLGLFLLQLAAVVFTQSRGPIVGLMAELLVFVMLVGLLRRRRRWALTGAVAAVLTVSVIILMNIPGLAADGLQRLPYLQRFGDIVESAEVQARVLAWETVLETVRVNPLRTLFGYGPETMKPVFTEFMPARLWVLQGGGQYGTFDRAHNAVFDALYAEGIVSAVLFLLLYGLVFYQGLRWLGLVQSPRESRWLMVLLGGGAVLGLVVPGLWRGDLVLAGIGMPAGMVAGLVLYLVGKLLFAPLSEPPADELRLLLIAALLAASVGHFAEVQTGIGIVSTRAYFWLYVALMILLGAGRIEAPSAMQPAGLPTADPGRRSRRGRYQDRAVPLASSIDALRPTLVLALVTAALLGTLSYAFIHGFSVSGARVPAQVLIWSTWLFAGGVIVLERDRFGPAPSVLSNEVLAYTAVSLLWLLPFVIFHRTNAQALERLNASYVAFLVWVLLTLAGMVLVMYWGRSASWGSVPAGHLAVCGLVVVLAFVWVWRVDVTRVRADIHEKVGKTALGAGLLDQAIPHLQQAVALQPQQDQYYIYLGGAYVEQARQVSDVATKDALMQRARETFETARALVPRDSDHPRQLGLLYRIWADWAQDAATRQQRLQQSLRYYQTAVALNPENPDLRLDLAGVYFTSRMNAEALAEYQHVVRIGSPDHLARAYAGLGDIHLVQNELDAAVGAYRQAMQSGRDQQQVVQARVDAVGSNPQDLEVHESLGLVYAAAGRQQEAIQTLTDALVLASSDGERAEVEKLIDMIQE